MAISVKLGTLKYVERTVLKKIGFVMISDHEVSSKIISSDSGNAIAFQ